MGFPSVSTHRGLVHWQGLLLVVSLLNFWCLATTDELGIFDGNVTEGENVLFPFDSKITNFSHIKWYRGKGMDEDQKIAFLIENPIYHIRGPAEGHVFINYDGSLMLMNVTMNDTGVYTVVLERPHLRTLTGYVYLNVYARVRVPTLLASNTTVTRNKDSVVFTCYTDMTSVQWLFNGMDLQLTERMKLSQDHKILKIDRVQRKDAGYYQCKVSNNIHSVKSAPLKLVVKSG